MKTNRITWGPPIGEGFVVSPSREQLEDVVLRSGSEFWDHPSGSHDGGLFYDLDSMAISELKLMYSAPDLFCVVWTDCEAGLESVLSSQMACEGMLTVRPGGNAWSLPRKYFVERELAWQAVECFLVGGDRSPDLQWIPFEPPDIL